MFSDLLKLAGGFKMYLIAFAVGAAFLTGFYQYAKSQGKKECVNSVTNATVKAIEKQRDDERKSAQDAIRRADSVAKQLEELRRKQNEEPVAAGCTPNAAVLQRLETIANSTK